MTASIKARTHKQQATQSGGLFVGCPKYRRFAPTARQSASEALSPFSVGERLGAPAFCLIFREEQAPPIPKISLHFLKDVL